jgi:DNA-binding MarR family transcriptional regulator
MPSAWWDAARAGRRAKLNGAIRCNRLSPKHLSRRSLCRPVPHPTTRRASRTSRPAVPEDHGDLVRLTLALLRRVGAAASGWQRTPVGGRLTVHQALVLHHLVHHGQATPTGLAEWLHVTRGSITPCIQRLEELGLAARRPDAQDGRRQWLHATAAGRRLAPQIEETVLHPALEGFRDWSAGDLRHLAGSLQRLLGSSLFGGTRP